MNSFHHCRQRTMKKNRQARLLWSLFPYNLIAGPSPNSRSREGSPQTRRARHLRHCSVGGPHTDVSVRSPTNESTLIVNMIQPIKSEYQVTVYLRSIASSCLNISNPILISATIYVCRLDGPQLQELALAGNLRCFSRSAADPGRCLACSR